MKHKTCNICYMIRALCFVKKKAVRRADLESPMLPLAKVIFHW